MPLTIYLTIPEMARDIGIDADTVNYRLGKLRIQPALMLGNRRGYTAKDLEAVRNYERKAPGRPKKRSTK